MMRLLMLLPLTRIMFWIQIEGPTSSAIMKAPMDAVDGRSIRLVKALVFRKPTGIAIDYNKELIFWVDAKYSQIQWADYDGGNMDTIDIIHISFVPQHIHVREDSLYWSGNDVAGSDGGIFKIGISNQDIRQRWAVLMSYSQLLPLNSTHMPTHENEHEVHQ